MPQFVIERDIPGVGNLGPADLQGASQKSCDVLRDLGPEIQWVHSYVTEDKIYCIYRAPSEALIRQHAETAGFPANRIARVRATIDPTTAETDLHPPAEARSAEDAIPPMPIILP